jgi:NAD(P)-dependent dehydrogenase (short-subunit alcohol dehydrogenase family)
MKTSARRVALITGGSRGIGRATAELFSEKGYDVVVLDISGKGSTNGGVKRGGKGEYTFIRCDVSNEDEVASAVKNTEEVYGRIDCLLNIAGVVLVKPLEEITWREYRRTFDVNIGGMFLTCKHVVPLMKARRAGAIVNMGSVSGHVGQVRHAIYGSTKGAVLSFTKALAWELAPYGIRVNSVSPGSVDTPMLRDDVSGEARRLGVSFEKMKKEREGEQAFRRWADPREVAEAIYFLASDSASFITGTDLLVDCGWTAR